MTYSKFIDKLRSYVEEEYAAFHRRLTPTKYQILGIRVQIMRKLAKEYKSCLAELLLYPNEYYEVVFIKLTIISMLPYEEFVAHLDYAVSLIDNWAHCDSFRAKCLRKHKKEFLFKLEKLFAKGGEYYQRYVLVTLLSEYMEEEYFSVIEHYLQRADLAPYYIHMAAAWLVAEILVKHYEYGVELLNKRILDKKTYNKAIQKAIESYRLTKEQKEFLRSLKIK